MLRPRQILETLATVRMWHAAALAAGLLALTAAGPAQAAPIQFASFVNDSGNPFSYVYGGGTSASFSANTDVIFKFTAATGLGTQDRLATLSISGSTNNAAGSGDNTPNTLISQPINQVSSMVITEKSTGKLLLSMSFTGILSGAAGGPNASIIGATDIGDTVQFASDYLAFQVTGNSYLLNMPTVTPGLAISASKYIQSFTSNINGQFTAIAAVPQPTSVVMFGTGMAATLLLARRNRRRFSRVGQSG